MKGELRIETTELSFVTVRGDTTWQERRPDAGEHEALHELEISADQLARREQPSGGELIDQVLTTASRAPHG